MNAARAQSDYYGRDSVNLGGRTVSVPFVDIFGGKPGKTLLVTAGMDGDEYAGIVAARRLADEYTGKKFSGTLSIIPVVNIPGFETGMSRNPLDGLYPKHIYPGKHNGKPTERLMWWVSTKAATADCWFDMHGGSLTETVEPFVGGWESGNVAVDSFVMDVIRIIDCPYGVYEKGQKTGKSAALARHGCGYVLAESGELGKTDTQAVDRHVRWARQVMGAMGMIQMKQTPQRKRIFRTITEYRTGYTGTWRPLVAGIRQVKQGDVIGDIVLPSGRTMEHIRARESGHGLWYKIGSPVRRGDVVAGIGSVLL
jgi:uncharacterized protein